MFPVDPGSQRLFCFCWSAGFDELHVLNATCTFLHRRFWMCDGVRFPLVHAKHCSWCPGIGAWEGIQECYVSLGVSLPEAS